MLNVFIIWSACEAAIDLQDYKIEGLTSVMQMVF